MRNRICRLRFCTVGPPLYIACAAVYHSAAVNADLANAVEFYWTSADEAHLFERQFDLKPTYGRAAGNKDPHDSAVKVRLDVDHWFQVLDGFGATLTDSSAYVISRLPNTARQQLLMRLFGKNVSGGIGLNFLRLPIGATDNSVSYQHGRLTYDDTLNDFSLSNFSTSADDEYYLPLIREIQKVNPDIVFMASPWTAPLWLKTNSRTPGAGSLGHSAKVVNAYAEYLVKYLEDYKSKGVRIKFLTLQNEPGHGGCGPMPCMTLWPDQESKFAEIVAGQLASSSVSGVRLLAYDHNWGPTAAEIVVSGSTFLLIAMLLLGAVCLLLIISQNLKLKWSRCDNDRSSTTYRLLEQTRDETEPLPRRCKCCLTVQLPSIAAVALGLWWLPSIFPSAFPVIFGGIPMGPPYPFEVLTSSAGTMFSGVAWHCYGGSPLAMRALDASLIGVGREPVDHYITECTNTGSPFGTDLRWNQQELLIGGANNGAKAIMHWSLALDEFYGPHCEGGSCCSTCRGVVTVPLNATSLKDLRFNTEFWGLAHHSAFVPKESRRIDAVVLADSGNVVSTAYLTPGRRVVMVVANIAWEGNVTLQAFLHDYFVEFSMPPGVATLVWRLP